MVVKLRRERVFVPDKVFVEVLILAFGMLIWPCGVGGVWWFSPSCGWTVCVRWRSVVGGGKRGPKVKSSIWVVWESLANRRM